MADGRFVAVEGIDGAGKTTLVRRLAALAERNGVETTVVSRYFLPELTALWRRLVAKDAVTQAEAAALAAHDYAAGCETTVVPALEEGRLVLADRSVWSHRVHFALRGVALDVFDGVLEPDLVLHVVLPPDEALARLRPHGKPDLWEAGLDYRLGVSIGAAQRLSTAGDVSRPELERHFLAHQQAAAALFKELLPEERTIEIDGHVPAGAVGAVLFDLPVGAV